ncbi:MAG TPA: hypothetical protein VNT26_02715, partial [Candidatus Sulfotelmatobacter sp.]|nr:hypothetical protein [Candidatus Sulfotelmatobacter sp.]
DKLNVSDVTASYRTFLGYERDLNDLNDQFEKLKAIRTAFTRLSELRRDRALTRYLEAELRHEHTAEQLQTDEKKLTGLKQACADEEARLKQLDEVIPELQRQLDNLKGAINETPEGRLYSEIKSRNEKLSRQIAQLAEIGSSLEHALANRLRNARAWLKELNALPLDLDPAATQALERAIHLLEAGGVPKAGETLAALGQAAQRAAAEAGKAAAPTHKRLGELRQQLGQLRDEIAALKVGKLPFPTRLLDALNHGLPARGGEASAQPLCKLCEVTDERWRPAIEVAFGRKFAIVVASEHYDQAEKLYHSLKATELGNETGRESLINPARALKLKKPIRAGSLAEKLQATHPVAEALVSHLFGELTCAESLAELRALPPDQNGILPDGFMTRGAFVERPRFYDGNPFVGKRGLEQQLAWKEKQAASLQAEERKLSPIERALKAISEGWREHFEVAPGLYQDLASAQQLPKLQQELQENLARLKTIDRARFDELALQQARLETDLKQFGEEQRTLDRSEKRAELRQLELRVGQCREETARLAEKLAQVRNETDVSAWLKRMQELRADMLTRYPVKEVAANRFNEQFHTHDRDAAAAWEEVKAKRHELALAHAKFEELSIESETNEAYDRQLAKLE